MLAVLERERGLETAQDLEAFFFGLAESAWTLAAFRCALEAGMLDGLSEARTVEKIAGAAGLARPFVESVFSVLAAAGVVRPEGGGFVAAPALSAALAGPMREFIRSDLASHQLQAVDIVRLGGKGSAGLEGWKHVDGDLLEAQGTRSAFLPVSWARQLFPTLDGLVDRLGSPTARALDVGTGVGRLAIALCQLYPALRVVGIDHYEVPLVRARVNVEQAGMGERVQLRRERIEDLSEEAAFDFIWVPTFFLSATALAASVPCVLRALRPGGWAVFGCLSEGSSPQLAAVFRLVALAWGSDAYLASDVGGQLTGAGFTSVRYPAPPSSVPVQHVVARRPD